MNAWFVFGLAVVTTFVTYYGICGWFLFRHFGGRND